MKNLSLALIAISLSILIPIGICYSLLTRGLNGIRTILKAFALAWDRLGNAICADMFNDLLLKPHGHRFGNGAEFISTVFGLNKATDTLYPLGKKVADILNWVDPNHVEKSVKNNANK